MPSLKVKQKHECIHAMLFLYYFQIHVVCHARLSKYLNIIVSIEVICFKLSSVQ